MGVNANSMHSYRKFLQKTEGEMQTDQNVGTESEKKKKKMFIHVMNGCASLDKSLPFAQASGSRQ